MTSSSPLANNRLVVGQNKREKDRTSWKYF